MVVLPNERVPIARLLRFLEQGELLAHACARRQAALAPDPRAARFLLGQARQEAAHALVFHAAIQWLAPRGSAASPLLPPLERYRALLEAAIRRRSFAETLLAEQIILEGLGEAILTRIEAGLVKRQAGFGWLRRILLHQEEAHYAFGRRALDREIAAGRTSIEALQPAGAECLALAQDMVTTLADLFDSIDEDAGAWAADINQYLPSWLASPLTPHASRLTSSTGFRLTPYASRPR
jgi:hypothetical protein